MDKVLLTRWFWWILLLPFVFAGARVVQVIWYDPSALGPDPAQALVDLFGTTALWFLCAVLFVTPRAGGNRGSLANKAASGTGGCLLWVCVIALAIVCRPAARVAVAEFRSGFTEQALHYCGVFSRINALAASRDL